MKKLAALCLAVGMAGTQLASAEPAPEPREFAIFFYHGGAWIPEDAQAMLPQIAEIYTRGDYRALAVDCYSDDLGTQKVNVAMTRDRANRIKAELVRYGVPEKAVTAIGHGFDPMVSFDDDAEAQAPKSKKKPRRAPSNRRCTMVLK